MKKLVLALPFLVGCPGSWGFGGIVQVAKGDHVDAINVDGLPSVPAGATTLPPGTTITCDGCGEKKHLDVLENGLFHVSLGSHYDAPGPITLHVRASGYQPLDLEVSRAGMLSQAGISTLVIVLVPIGGTGAAASAPAAVDPLPPPAEPDAGAIDR